MKTSLTITLNIQDCECHSGDFNHRNEAVFDKSRDEEISEMLCYEYPVRTKQKKKLRGKGGWKINNENKSLWLIFLKYIFEFMINTARPASNSVHQQKFTENDFKYNNFLIYTLSWATWRSGLGADLPIVRIRHSTQLQ